MLSTNTVTILIGVLIISMVLYGRHADKQHRENAKHHDCSAIRKYLLNETALAKTKKPILWVHIPYEYNSRNWDSFGSRSSMELNQPYLYLTVKSIIKHCEKDFFICIIDDTSFGRVVPDWSIDMSRLSDPLLTNMRNYAMAKLVHFYGGMTVPLDFLCFKNLIELYQRGTRGGKAFVCENVNANITHSSYDFYPDMRFMGAPKENDTMKAMLDFMQRQMSADHTDEGRFLGEINRWSNHQIKKGAMNLIDGKEVGVKTMDNTQVLVDDLFSENYIDLYTGAFGIWIPSTAILKRTNYEWFARLSVKQVLESDVILGKYILVASAPDNVGKEGALRQATCEARAPAPDWVGFYKTPLISDGVYGLNPSFLGDDVLKQ
jgi:hypothetical protein